MMNCADMPRRLFDRAETSDSWRSPAHTHTHKMANNIRFNRLKLHRLTNFSCAFLYFYFFCFILFTLFSLKFWINFNPSRWLSFHRTNFRFYSQLLRMVVIPVQFWDLEMMRPDFVISESFTLNTDDCDDKRPVLCSLLRFKKLHLELIYHFRIFSMTLAILNGTDQTTKIPRASMLFSCYRQHCATLTSNKL